MNQLTTTTKLKSDPANPASFPPTAPDDLPGGWMKKFRCKIFRAVSGWGWFVNYVCGEIEYGEIRIVIHDRAPQEVFVILRSRESNLNAN